MYTLAHRYWPELPWDGSLGRNDDFRMLEDSTVVDETKYSLEFFDDVTIVVLFSVFEQTIRDHVREKVQEESVVLAHPVLQKAAEDAVSAVEFGSFAKVLEPYKVKGHADLIEEVNQVRRYRNWVAHGRRGDQPPSVAPEMAYERLSRCLAIIIPSEETSEGST